MYHRFYDLRREPFNITPDPAFLFLSASHKEALACIVYGIDQRKGFVAVTGGVGVGKTTVIRSYLENVIERKQTKIIYIFNSNTTFLALLKTIYGELELTPVSVDVFEMVQQLHRVLISEYRQGRNVALIIDEAQNMPSETLENLRMLSNLETSNEKLLQIVLIGQSELEEQLAKRQLRQLNQRIAVRTRIQPLTKKESIAYIQHRLTIAGSRGQAVFTDASIKAIVRRSRGIPRVINILCSNALLLGYGTDRKPVNGKMAKKVIADYWLPKRKLRFRLAVSLFATMVLAMVIVFYTNKEREVINFPVKVWRFFHLSGSSLTGTTVSPVAKPSKHLFHNAPPEGTKSNVPGAAVKSPLNTDGTEKSEPVPVIRQSKNFRRSLAIGKPEAGVVSGENAGTAVIKVGIPAAGPKNKGSISIQRSGIADPVVPVYKVLPEGQLRPPTGLEKVPGQPGSTQSIRKNQESKSDNFVAITRIVQKGDNLTRLVREVYGVANGYLIHLVKQNNPQLRDINHIQVSSTILFPRIPESSLGTAANFK